MILVVTNHNFFKEYHDLCFLARQIVHRRLPVGATPNALIGMRERLARLARQAGYVSKVHMNEPKSRHFHFRISFGPEILASGPLPCWIHAPSIIDYVVRKPVDGWYLHVFIYCTLRNGDENTKIIVTKTARSKDFFDIATETCVPGRPRTIVEVDGCLRIEIWTK